MDWSRIYRPPLCTRCLTSFSTMACVTGPLVSNYRFTTYCVSELFRFDDLIFLTHWELWLKELGGDRTEPSRWMPHFVSQDIVQWSESATLSTSRTLVLLTDLHICGSQTHSQRYCNPSLYLCSTYLHLAGASGNPSPQLYPTVGSWDFWLNHL